jgi:hypothetical protein
MAISDFVLLYNKAAEALAKSDRLGHDFYTGISDTKALWIKYCKPYEKRLQSMVPALRVVPAGTGEDPTTVSVAGFLVDAKAKGKKSYAPKTVEMQFIEKHKKLYLELHRDLGKQEYAPQSEASLTNFQTLLLLEIALLMGCDLDWGTASPEGASGGAAILPAAGGKDDGDSSTDSEGAGAGNVAAKTAGARRRRRPPPPPRRHRRRSCRRRHRR